MAAAAPIQNLTAIEPLYWLAQASANNEISANERDAGEILHRLALVARDGAPQASVSYKWRDKDNNWSVRVVSRLQARADLANALQHIRTDARRKAMTLALVAREPVVDTNALSPLVAGLEDLTKHWWGAVAITTFVTPKGVTLATMKPVNDNTPTKERVAKGDISKSSIVLDNFSRMHTKGQLDEDDFVNDDLHAAGLRYQSDHHGAGLNPLGAIDYERPMVDGGGAQLVSESMMNRRDAFRQARASMGEKYAKVVDAVVIDGMTLFEAGRMAGVGKKAVALVTAKERLNFGLRLLAQHYGIMRRAA